MQSGCWITVLLLLLLPAATQGQSGDRDSDMDYKLSCISHIMIENSSLSCEVIGDRIDNEDDEDTEAELIEKITACYDDLRYNKLMCAANYGDTINFGKLSPVILLNVTVNLRKGAKISEFIDLKKIVKPRSPQVWNVTFNLESNIALIHVRTPYQKEYLRVDNQIFQLHIQSTKNEKFQDQNITSSEHIIMAINMVHLQGNTVYRVKARAIPHKYLQGTWSEWSETFSFITPSTDPVIPQQKVQNQTDEQWEIYQLILSIILMLVVLTSVIILWKIKIFTYMWPSIPHPKNTLVQICKPNKGLLLNVKPEVFSALKIYPVVKPEVEPCEEANPSIAAAEGTQSTLACSIQSSDCSRNNTSVSTEEQELSLLLSKSSSDEEDSLRSTSPSPINGLQLRDRPDTPQSEHSSEGNEAEVFGVGQQEEAYVTMSSFYQIK